MRSCALFLIFGFASGLKFSKTSQEPEFSYDLEEDTNPKKTLGKIIGNCSFGKACPNAKAPSVAVCIAGLSRRFVHPQQCQFINSMLLQPIEAAGAVGLNRSKPDVFVNVKLGGYPNVALDRNSTLLLQGGSISNVRENVMAAAEDVGAVNTVVEDGWGAGADRKKLENPSCFRSGHSPVEGVMSYFRSMYGCLQQMEDEEKKTSKRYDFVIQMRPDTNEIETQKEITVAAVQCEKSMYVRDAVSYQTRAAFNVYANVWNDQFQNKNPSMCHMKASNEHFTMDAAAKINQMVGPAQYIR